MSRDKGLITVSSTRAESSHFLNVASHPSGGTDSGRSRAEMPPITLSSGLMSNTADSSSPMSQLLNRSLRAFTSGLSEM